MAYKYEPLHGTYSKDVIRELMLSKYVISGLYSMKAKGRPINAIIERTGKSLLKCCDCLESNSLVIRKVSRIVYITDAFHFVISRKKN